MPIDKMPPGLRLDDADGFYRRYCEACRRLGVTPVPLERASELVETWNATFESARATRQ